MTYTPSSLHSASLVSCVCRLRTRPSAAGVRPAASAVSCKGPAPSRGPNKAAAGPKAPGSGQASSSLTGGFKSPLQKGAAASGATSSRDTGGSNGGGKAAGAGLSSRGWGGAGAGALGWGSGLAGMTANFRVSGLRRPVRK